MVKKKIDNRIRVMIENGVKLGHRTMFIIVGDKARDQVWYTYENYIGEIQIDRNILRIEYFPGANFVRYVDQVNR